VPADLNTKIGVADFLARYAAGEREFKWITIDPADFRGRDISDVEFYESSLRHVSFDGARLTGVQLLSTDLGPASLADADFGGATLGLVSLRGASAERTSWISARLIEVDLKEADFTGADFRSAQLDCDAKGAIMDGATLGFTVFSAIDLSPFCDARGLAHLGPSYVDLGSILMSCHHPGLKRFLVDCGLPPNLAEFTIEAAQAEGADVMQSTFISYGGPDEAFARRLYDELRAHGVTTFFFPESARLGERIGNEVRRRIQEHDRVILVCSRDSLDRPGVRNEIQETFDREARDGGASYLLPITLDDYLLHGWADPLAQPVRDRIAGDFGKATSDPREFDKQVSRLLQALRKNDRGVA
jgi:uncharacterized protein YjbI with pentapeptide repeats